MSWGIEEWSDEEALWGPIEEPRFPVERDGWPAAAISCTSRSG